MFTNAEIKERLNRNGAGTVQAVNLVKFDQSDFLRPESEQFISICWKEKKEFVSILEFWITSMNALAENGIIEKEYIESYLSDESFLFKEISGHEARNLVDSSLSQLKGTVNLPIAESITDGMKMIDDWDLKEIICVSETYYMLFRWETTA